MRSTERSTERSAEATRYRKLYATARWRAVRLAQLRAHPLCQRCRAAGFTTAATVCNHVDLKTKLDPATFFDGPFESVCKPCHDGPIQSQERTGRPSRTVGYTGGVDAGGWPSDARHPANRHG